MVKFMEGWGASTGIMGVILAIGTQAPWTVALALQGFAFVILGMSLEE